jgi:hypothetical protein
MGNREARKEMEEERGFGGVVHVVKRRGVVVGLGFFCEF